MKLNKIILCGVIVLLAGSVCLGAGRKPGSGKEKEQKTENQIPKEKEKETEKYVTEKETGKNASGVSKSELRGKDIKIKLGEDKVHIPKGAGVYKNKIVKKEIKRKDWTAEIQKEIITTVGRDYVAKTTNEWGPYEGVEKGKIEVYEISGKKLFEISANELGRTIEDAHILKNGKYLVFRSDALFDRSILKVYDKQGNLVLEKENVPEGELWISPNGKYLLYKVKKDNVETIFKFDYRGENKEVIKEKGVYAIKFSNDGKYYVVMCINDLAGRLYKIELFTFLNDKLQWINKKLKTFGLPESERFSKKNKYFIIEHINNVQYGKNSIGTKIITGYDTYYCIYDVITGEIIVNDELKQEKVKEYKDEIIK